jgi:hypothetical protein
MTDQEWAELHRQLHAIAAPQSVQDKAIADYVRRHPDDGAEGDELIAFLAQRPRGKRSAKWDELVAMRECCRYCDEPNVEQYMVASDVWKAVAPTFTASDGETEWNCTSGFVCLSCLCERTPRPLTSEDFSSCYHHGVIGAAVLSPTKAVGYRVGFSDTGSHNVRTFITWFPRICWGHTPKGQIICWTQAYAARKELTRKEIRLAEAIIAERTACLKQCALKLAA